MRRVLASCVAVSLGLPSVAVAAPAEAGEVDPELAKAQTLYDRGKAKFDTTEYNEAIRLWTEAYEILSDTPQNAPVKAAIIYNLATARERQFEIDKDITHLRRAVKLMEQYAAAIPELYGEGEEADEESRRIEERLAGVRVRLEEEEEAAGESPAPETGVPEPEPSPPKDVAKSDPKARAFVIAGATLTGVGVVGLGIMAGGLALGSSSNDISDLDPDDLDGRREQFDRGRAGNVMAYVGGAIGGAALLTGAVLLGVGLKRRAASTAATPLLAPGLAGISLQRRF